jgi:putative ABC transport system permease protein
VRVPLAWHNVTHNKRRAAASLSGVCLAILLMFMQLGFFDACFRSATRVFDQYRFDIALVSPQYVHMRGANVLPRQRLQLAKAVPGVMSATPMYVATGFWKNPQTHENREMLIVGVDPRQPSFALPELIVQAPKLERPGTALVDTRAQKGYGTVVEGTVTELENKRIEVAGTYSYGSGFVCDAGLIVSDRTLSRIMGGYPLDQISLGLITVEPGRTVEAVAAELRRLMPADVKVMLRSELEAHEQNFYVDIKPVGIMFSAGVLLAFVVGAVILYQILSSEIMNRLKEYATLKAIGYTNTFMTRVVLQQAAIFALVGYVPALIFSLVLYRVTEFAVDMPMVMTAARLALVLGMSVGMCALAGVLVSRKVRRTDPAELF